MRSAVMRYSDVSSGLQHQLKEAEDKIAGSDRRLLQFAANEGELKKEVAELREESSGLREESLKLREESSVLREAFGNLQSTVAERESELAKLRRLVADQSVENEGLQKLRELAEEKAQTAESKAQAAEDRALSAENNRELEVVTAISRAVEDYKSSAAFERDASDACSDFYKFGYADCIAKAAEEFPGLDIARLALQDGEEEDKEEGELSAPGLGDEKATEGSAQEPVVIESPEHVPAKE